MYAGRVKTIEPRVDPFTPGAPVPAGTPGVVSKSHSAGGTLSACPETSLRWLGQAPPAQPPKRLLQVAPRPLSQHPRGEGSFDPLSLLPREPLGDVQALDAMAKIGAGVDRPGCDSKWVAMGTPGNFRRLCRNRPGRKSRQVGPRRPRGGTSHRKVQGLIMLPVPTRESFLISSRAGTFRWGRPGSGGRVAFHNIPYGGGISG